MTLTALKYGETTLPDDWIFKDGAPEVKRPIFESPRETIARLGAAHDSLDGIVLTHTHRDHADGLCHFGNCPIYVHSSEAENVRTYLRLEDSDESRVVEFDSELELSEGFTVQHIGVHSVGSSVVLLRHEGVGP